MKNKPITIARVIIDKKCFINRYLKGKVVVGEFEWTFTWLFGQGELWVKPALGRALIKDALERFLIRVDYNLEIGREYDFTVRGKF